MAQTEVSLIIGFILAGLLLFWLLKRRHL